jgi:acetyl esterase/lipase
MSFAVDAELAQELATLVSAGTDVEAPPVGDWAARRVAIGAAMVAMGALLPARADVTRTDAQAVAEDGATIPMRWYGKGEARPGSAVVYLHGGGMILGSVEMWEPFLVQYVAATGVPILGVDYRYAPEHPHPTPVEDCYAGFRWLVEHGAELGVDPARIAVMGDSGGGGVAAAVALLARDRGGPAPARQILIYAMLDDRTVTPDPAIAPFAAWTYDDNATGWGALLGGAAGGPDTSPYAAPARAVDLAGLAPAYVEVGELDIFRNENVEYARRLAAAGVSTELHVRPGAPHGFDAAGPETALARRAMADRHRIITAL